MSYFPQRGHVGPGNLDMSSSMGLAEFAVQRPSANVASIIPVGLMEVGAGLRTPAGLLPEIDFPVDF